ncbi:MAG: 50S ribosomal protein L4 [Clostridia bacterium]|nr:50S ribosomal protein L4 [Clostridia bacterium]
MPNVKVYNMAGAEVGELALNETIFGAEINEVVLHQAVKTYLANQRQGTQSTLTRTEVSGGGKKPWRQKGTGRARQGSTRAPQWTHGGIALGPKPRDHRIFINKKVRKAALFSALSAKVVAGDLVVVDQISMDEFKTATIAKMLKAFGFEKQVQKNYKTYKLDENGELLTGPDTIATRTATVPQSALVVLPAVDEHVVKSVANIAYAQSALATNLNVYEVLHAEKLVLTVDAVKKLEEVYAG